MKYAKIISKMSGRSKTRFLVRIRDNFTCQDCGIKRTYETVQRNNKDKKTLKGQMILKGRIKLFDVHHLNGLCGKKTKGYDKIKDMKNLITLCHKCHYNRSEHKCKSDKWSEDICLRNDLAYANIK